MAYSSFFRLPAALVGCALLLSGCCANNQCDCNDEQADAITLRFTAGFAAADLDTIIIRRSPLPFLATNKSESVTLIRTAAQARDSILLNNNAPFTQVSATKLNGYRYEIQYFAQLPKAKPLAITVLVIDSVSLAGRLEGIDCCTCYTNTQKLVYAKKARKNSTALDSAFTVDLNANQPRILEVRK